MNRESVAIYGASGFGREVAWLVESCEGLEAVCNAKFGVAIEDEVQIGSHCSIYSISTIDDKVGEVVLKRNCRIGTHSTIMPGVTVGGNAVVGAHSFVNRDVPDGVTVVGVPAKVVKRI